ncbi:hypothetical protein NL676_014549 [Syzygium grande]|nr:hypothetical protein NL676_014549 [Syzygium grande]
MDSLVSWFEPIPIAPFSDEWTPPPPPFFREKAIGEDDQLKPKGSGRMTSGGGNAWLGPVVGGSWEPWRRCGRAVVAGRRGKSEFRRRSGEEERERERERGRSSGRDRAF